MKPVVFTICNTQPVSVLSVANHQSNATVKGAITSAVQVVSSQRFHTIVKSLLHNTEN